MTESPDLTNCRGYRVEMAGDRIGMVVTLVPRTDRTDPSLIVHSGLVSCGLGVVPLDQIETVDHSGRRLVLHDQPVNLQQGAPSGARDRIPARA